MRERETMRERERRRERERDDETMRERKGIDVKRAKVTNQVLK